MSPGNLIISKYAQGTVNFRIILYSHEPLHSISHVVTNTLQIYQAVESPIVRTGNC